MHNRTLQRIFGDEEPPAEDSPDLDGEHAKQNKLQKWQGAGPGRPRGSPNRVNGELRQFIQRVLTDPEYQADVMRRARTGTLGGALEVQLWQLVLGKPVERLKLDATLQDERSPLHYESISTEELVEKTEVLLSQIRELSQLSAAGDPHVIDAVLADSHGECSASKFLASDSNSNSPNELERSSESPVITPPPSDDPDEQ